MLNGDERRSNFQHYINMRDDFEYASAYMNDAISEKLSPGYSCYPWNPDNVAEAMSNLDSHQYHELTSLIKDNCGSTAGDRLHHFILSYWRNMAKRIVEREMSNEGF